MLYSACFSVIFHGCHTAFLSKHFKKVIIAAESTELADITDRFFQKVYTSIFHTTRINEPWIAEELIANGKTDICMIGRPNLCDSEFANKAAVVKTDDIRPCIGCGRCLTGIMRGHEVVLCEKNQEQNQKKLKLSKDLSRR